MDQKGPILSSWLRKRTVRPFYRRRNQYRPIAAEEGKWVKKAILGFNLTSVAGGLVVAAFTNHQQLCITPIFAVVISVSAYFTSERLLHFNLKFIARLADHVGVLSGNVAFSWILFVFMRGNSRLVAFLPCVLSLAQIFELLKEIAVMIRSYQTPSIGTLASSLSISFFSFRCCCSFNLAAGGCLHRLASAIKRDTNKATDDPTKGLSDRSEQDPLPPV